MAIEQPGFKYSLVAAADLSALQFTFVKLDTAGKAAAVAAATDIPCGVLQNAPVSGQPAEIMASGISKIVAGADLARGAQIGTDSSGRAVALVNGTDTTKYVVGQVIYDNTTTAGFVSALINCLAPGRAA